MKRKQAAQLIRQTKWERKRFCFWWLQYAPPIRNGMTMCKIIAHVWAVAICCERVTTLVWVMSFILVATVTRCVPCEVHTEGVITVIDAYCVLHEGWTKVEETFQNQTRFILIPNYLRLRSSDGKTIMVFLVKDFNSCVLVQKQANSMPPHHKMTTWIITSEISLLLTRKQRTVATGGNHNHALARAFLFLF